MNFLTKTFITISYLLIISFIFPSCTAYEKKRAETSQAWGNAEIRHAIAHNFEAQAEIARAYALCQEAKSPKGIKSEAGTRRDCGVAPTSPVTATITDSLKQGEIAKFQMLPNPSVLLGPAGALLGTD